MNLHELIELPHGEATKRIKAAGKWDEYQGEVVREFHISYKLTSLEDFVVDARSPSEAIMKLNSGLSLNETAENVFVKEIK